MSNQQSLLSDDARITDVDIADRMEQSFLDYSMSVIVGRALPDVRDGLKPVQRRILYAMWEAGLRPDRPHRKCASAVGDVMKKYHPHGDSSIYEALVRMAQDFSSRAPLIDGHGNFGSVDGDPAAAMRYTEARLSPLAMVLLDGIDEDTVELIANYDGFEQEPVVLPARFPNLLVNGASGIAVGMATNIPPHNLREVVRACQELLVRPEATVDELMRLLPAPDFPTGARIVDTAGIRDAYLTGRGAITMEAVASTETRTGGLPRIIVTEIPYQVNKATLLEKLAELVKARKLEEIRDLRDESSRDGMRVVIELKGGEDPARVLARLYALSDLRTNFNVNMVALVDGQPRTIGLVEALTAYLAHQRDVLTRRTTFRRERAAARAHVLEGLLVALDHLDEVIALIRAADSADAARTQLMSRFSLTEVQATAILDMMLRRLAALERQRIAEEHAQLLALIAQLDAILGDPAKLDALLSEELATIADDHGDARRSRLIGAAQAQKGTAREGAGIGGSANRRGDPGGEAGELVTGQSLPELAAQAVTVYVTAGGVLKSVSQQRTSKPQGTARDPLVAVLRATTDDVLLLVDADGGGYRVGVGDVPVTTLRQRGTALAQLLGDGADAPLVGAVVLSGGLTEVLTVSARGLVKRTERAEFEGRARAMIAAGVRDDDRLVAAVGVRPDDDLLLASRHGQVIRFHVADVRPMGRAAAGVAGLSLPARAEVVAASAVPAGEDGEREVVSVAADGGAKRSPLAEFPTQGRGGKGVTTGTPALAWCGLAADLHLLSDGHPTVVRPAQLPAGRRSAAPAPGVLPGAIEAPVVAETASAAP